MYRDAPSSTRSRTRTPLLTAGSATFWIRRQSAGLVKRGLSRAAGLFPATPGTPGWCVGDRSPGAGSGAGGGSSGADACMSSDSGSISSATAPVAVSGNSSCMAVSDSDCTAGSRTTILVIRMPDGAPRDVREPAKSGVAPARGLVAADEPMPRENTNAWIAIDVAMETTITRRLSLRRISTPARSDVNGSASSCSCSKTMRARGPEPNRAPYAFCAM